LFDRGNESYRSAWDIYKSSFTQKRFLGRIARKKETQRMSIARINMMEFLTEKDLESSENLYEAIQKEWFANAQTVINIRTGPKSLLNLAVYSSYEDAETNLPKRKEFQDILKNKFTVVDSFYYEGDITYFESSDADKITTERKA
jgi:hypothetical protein